ncbi:GcvT family protein [Phaeobacter gallaeciensis]|uniref:GcvT family protein n=1 Tax=Phaeobacter gallaeciensis TaxID=60890 RepID=UPI00237F0143|nr:FAD-dependent oxidoreductase [Phaeobacter gallaeciensis]MDE4097907.1 FAD-dependent oxidoreductase [Phaeobacter gallaeciensis]MDE4106834.1 FAD-dependent oxidoreductase [Phaeobacter gallaeciensis]MDE4111288.1 FAD-dependent oxidoreductase [Phaeobacter gallaeciensis]MDE4115642.1 FAD-dependent oxidoreductase [Phaeobacter gallaeciensis]MDE4120229.1 FAD-dependent oxidoreductase [Phaeobacter gallaeciensis]
MSDFPSKARVVIIGGGVVGCSSLYHLAKRGWSDCVLLEKNELTAGSTWHAAGNVPTFSTSWSIMNMQRYSTELYARLGDEVDYPMNYHQTGSIRLAHTKERMQEFERAAAMGRYQGMGMEILTPEEAKVRYPFLETHDLAGALYDPNDGDIDPAQVTQALAKGARDMGAKILRFCPATGVTQTADGWIVHTDKGDIACDYVVNAAGYYAQRVGEWFKPYGGRTVPMMVMSHQYLLSEEIPEIEAHTKETGKKLPLLRDVDVSYYLRQEKHGFNLGPYEPNCRAHWDTDADPMPEDFSFQLWNDDLDRIEEIVTDAMERVPALATSGVSRVINGPIPYAPDGLPLLGPMPGVKNAFEACVFTFGIAQGGGAGKVLAEWIVDGQTEWDMWSCDPRRYTDYTDHQYCVDKGMEVYGHEYAMHFPRHEWPAGRDRKLSPVHDRVKALGGQMGAYNGWERANWFAKDDDDTSEEATRTWGRSGPWEARIREECEAVRDHCGVLDLPGFSRFEVKGPGARDWLLGKITGGLPGPGRMGLAYFTDTRGRILTEMSVMWHGEDHYMLITAATAQWHDYDVLAHDLPEWITLSDRTKDFSTLIVTGPAARDIFTSIGTEADLSLPWLSVQSARVSGRDCGLARVSFAGELGWEIHAAPEDIPALYEAVLAAGAKPFGMYALNSLRIEKGYRAWKGDLSTDYSAIEGGLDRFIRLNKPHDFPGKAILAAEAQDGPAKRFVTLIVEAGEADAPYMSCIWKDGEIVGETTSGDWGYRVGASVALGMVRSDLATPGTELEVEIYGQMHRAVVQKDEPLWDPENARLRA